MQALCLLAFMLAGDAADEKALLAMEKAWAAAIEKRDGPAIEAILADGFVSIEADGSVLDSKQYIAARLQDPLKIESSTLAEVKVRLHGPAATVTGRYQVAGKLDGKAVAYDFRYVDVYVKQPAGWKCISTQLTPIK